MNESLLKIESSLNARLRGQNMTSMKERGKFNEEDPREEYNASSMSKASNGDDRIPKGLESRKDSWHRFNKRELFENIITPITDKKLKKAELSSNNVLRDLTPVLSGDLLHSLASF